MTALARIAVNGNPERHASAVNLLASYGVAAMLHPFGTAFGADVPDAVWLTFERACVPVLALMSPAWSGDCLGGLASIGSTASLRETMAELGFAVADAASAQTIEGYVWDGVFHPAATTASAARWLALAALAQRICAALAVTRSYLRVESDASGRAIVDVTPVVGDAAAIASARLSGFCPVWAAWCLSAGRRPLATLLEIERRREALAS